MAALDQGAASVSVAQECADFRATGRRPRLGSAGQAVAGAPGLLQLRAVRLQRLPAQRPAGPERRPPPSSQMPPSFRCRQAIYRSRHRYDTLFADHGIRPESADYARIHRCTGDLLYLHPCLFAAAQARSDARRHRPGRAVYAAHHRRRGGGANHALVLAAGILHVPVPQSGASQTLFRTMDNARPGRTERPGPGLSCGRSRRFAKSGNRSRLSGGAGAGAVRQHGNQPRTLRPADGDLAALSGAAVLDQPGLAGDASR